MTCVCCRPRPASGRRRSRASWQCVRRGGSLQCAGVQLQPLSWRLGAREVAHMLQHNWFVPSHTESHVNHTLISRPTNSLLHVVQFHDPLSHAITASRSITSGLCSLSLAGDQLLSTQSYRLNTTFCLLYCHPPNVCTQMYRYGAKEGQSVHRPFDRLFLAYTRAEAATAPMPPATPAVRRPRGARYRAPDSAPATKQINIRSTGSQQGPRGGTSESASMHM
jgi:hypothetical protein